MTYCYHIFGLNIISELPLPSHPICYPQPHTAPDIIVEYGDTPVTLANPQFKGVRYQAAPGEFQLCLDNIARYHVQNGSRITITPDNGAKDEDIILFLMGSVMGALLHQRNILVLHAGAIEVNGKSVIFAGPSGVGKSTLTAGFPRRGYHFFRQCAAVAAKAAVYRAVRPDKRFLLDELMDMLESRFL